MTHYKVLILSKETTGGTGKFIKYLVTMPSPQVKFMCTFYKKHYLSSKLPVPITLSQSAYPNTFTFSVQKILLLIKNIFFTIRLLKTHHPNIVIACDFYSFVLFSVIKIIFLRKIIFITTIHLNIRKYTETKRGIYQYLLNFTFNVLKSVPDAYVTVSKGLSNQLQKEFHVCSEKITTIYNGVSLSNSRRKHRVRNKVQSIITVGRLDTMQKDYDTLLRSFLFVQQEFPLITMKIVGDGRDRSKLEKLINKYELGDKVQITGWVKDVSKYLIQSDVFVFSSFFEGFGYSLVEAMSVGLPVISTNIPFGPQEILDRGKYGLLVPVEDSNEMAQKLEILIRSKKTREHFAALALKRADDFSLGKMHEEYLQLFEKLQQKSN